MIPELYCTDWTTRAVFGHSGISLSFFDMNSPHRVVLSIFYTAELLGKEKGKAIMRETYIIQKEKPGALLLSQQAAAGSHT